MTGQALVETALALPVLLLLLLGIVGAGYLYLSVLRDQQAVSVLAQYAAVDPDWRNRVPDINEDSGCHAKPLQPELDGDEIVWTCHLSTGWMFDGLALPVRAIVGPHPTPEVSP